MALDGAFHLQPGTVGCHAADDQPMPLIAQVQLEMAVLAGLHRTEVVPDPRHL